VIVVETSKGAFEFETYPDDAPKTVANILALTKKGFYNGQRFHRVVPGFVIQAGDPQTRDMSKRDQWGRGAAAGSGKPVGVAEFSKKHLHTTGAVAMAHAGDAAQADSQFYVTLGPKPALNGKYAVFGHVISGADVPAKIEVGDVIKRMYVKGAPAK
jgi:peptidyl-prolyl cis-trans isomerase B (cyclophilin B)